VHRFSTPRPSAALVIACLALFVAIGGSAYAAAALAPGSVGTRQLKNGAVTLPKINLRAQRALQRTVTMWANVQANGTIVASRGIVGRDNHTAGSGIYDLTLNRDATHCAAVVSETGLGGYVTGGSAQAGVSGTILDVYTQYWSGSGFVLGEEPFSVAVLCPNG
jgi:hypothetical protein